MAAQGAPRKSEHRCKDCRYWYGADTDASPAGDRRFAPRVLSAPYRAAEVPA